MAELKTKRNAASPIDFLNKVEDDQKRKDSFEVLKMMQEITGEEPEMWGGSIIGFGTLNYKYASGREGTWMQTGFSPRKNALTLYIMSGYDGKEDLLQKLGKYKTGKSCLYIKKLDDVDKDVLKELIKNSLDHDDPC